MEQKSKTGGFLAGIMDSLFTEKAAADVPPSKSAASMLQDFDNTYSTLRRQVETLRGKAVPSSWSAAELESGEDLAGKKDRLNAIYAEMRSEITEMHQKLRTGISESDLQRSCSVLRELSELEKTSSEDGIESIVRARAAVRLVSECMPRAFETLRTIGKGAGITWPEPSGLPPWADGNAVEKSKRFEIAEIKESFLASPPARTADRAQGIVSVWGESYPTAGSAARLKFVLTAVGYGIAAVMIANVVELLRAEAPKLRSQAAELLDEYSKQLNEVLSRGVTEITEADRLLASTARLYNEIVPELIWQRAGKAVDEEMQRIARHAA